MAANQTLSNTLLLTDIPELATRFQALVPSSLRVHVAKTPNEAKKLLSTTQVEVIISCPQFAENSGFSFFDKLTVEYPDPIRIMITDVDEVQAAVSAINKGSIYKYLLKPLNKRQVLRLIDEASDIYRMRTSLNKKVVTYNDQLSQAEQNIRSLISDLDSNSGIDGGLKNEILLRLKSTLEYMRV